ncbi:molybdenum cofactor guanylyltransferase [Tsuneonella deserti]|uniref:Molybdenum cofactor guanylyltransferase n=1 Tax=Tsuneonella deserti TaxID=2035528 RepID=A0ABQ1SBY7_9SPHN|nr:molybdenum cofactor guanylyltransferase [Tsuneonella deserti]GGE00221.1 molybdenum cofactor guanylyltransferase [Tsuneonella deserti]
MVILAGGDGSRMGGAKPLRMLAGRTLLDRAIHRARSWSDDIFISARSAAQVGAAGLPLLLDEPGLGGPLAGLAAARSTGSDAVLTVPCDMPFLPTDLLPRLMEAFAGRGAALAEARGQVHPVCGLWRTEALGEIADYAASGRRSLIGFAERVGYSIGRWEAAEMFDNINTRADLAMAEARLA